MQSVERHLDLALKQMHVRILIRMTLANGTASRASSLGRHSEGRMSWLGSVIPAIKQAITMQNTDPAAVL